MSFLTAGPKEVRAWTIEKGTKAPQAAGKIHSDFERGFIRAEVVNFDDLMAAGGMTGAKEKGLVRSEGKDYVMRDGDVVLFRFTCNGKRSEAFLQQCKKAPEYSRRFAFELFLSRFKILQPNLFNVFLEAFDVRDPAFDILRAQFVVQDGDRHLIGGVVLAFREAASC